MILKYIRIIYGLFIGINNNFHIIYLSAEKLIKLFFKNVCYLCFKFFFLVYNKFAHFLSDHLFNNIISLISHIFHIYNVEINFYMKNI